MTPEPVEIVVDRLDADLFTEPSAALRRFALAAELGDDDALAWVLDEDRLDALPWSVRARAEGIVARRALLEGDLDRAERHLQRIYPGDPGYAQARLALGDLARDRGELKRAVLAYRDALGSADADLALIRIAAVYESIDRLDNADNYLGLVSPDAGVWGDAQRRRARVAVRQVQPREALGFLVVAARPSAIGWAPETDFVAASAYRELCRDGDADRMEAPARARVQRELAWLADRAAEPPVHLWTTMRTGPLASAFWTALTADPSVAPVLARLDRIEALPDSEIRDRRRAATLEQLGWLLAAQYRAADSRLTELLVPEPPRAWFEEPSPVLPWPFRGEYWADEIVAWPFRGEYWADEIRAVVVAHSECEHERRPRFVDF